MVIYSQLVLLVEVEDAGLEGEHLADDEGLVLVVVGFGVFQHLHHFCLVLCLFSAF